VLSLQYQVPYPRNTDSLKHIAQFLFPDVSGKRKKKNMKPSFQTDELKDYTKFSELYTQKAWLGDGGDGEVFAYEHKTSKALIAVKTPHAHNTATKSRQATKRLEVEIANLTILRQHEHIAGMLAWSGNHLPAAPAIFLPLCELGDLLHYIADWKTQQFHQSKSTIRISEVTVWKCLHDMALALDYMHNKYDNFGYVHNDVKPENILVDYPQGWNRQDGIPDEPVFKLTDFARMTRYPLPYGEKSKNYYLGTPEYAPPLSEQCGQRPSADIWALGATLQTLALSVFPVQSREAFVDSRRKSKEPAPILIDDGAWKKEGWRALIPTVYRPLSATQDELVKDHDVRGSISIDGQDGFKLWKHKPYSNGLNHWYEGMWQVKEDERLTAKQLVKYCVPRIAREIRVARNTEKSEECFERATALRAEIEEEYCGRKLEADGVPFDILNFPSYEGNGYCVI
jgi:serine/threonine protein kinase